MGRLQKDECDGAFDYSEHTVLTTFPTLATGCWEVHCTSGEGSGEEGGWGGQGGPAGQQLARTAGDIVVCGYVCVLCSGTGASVM